MNVFLFGQLTDITGSSEVEVPGVMDTDSLVVALNSLYPSLRNAKYIIAVEKKIIRSNTIINESTSVALLPPFSGG